MCIHPLTRVRGHIHVILNLLLLFTVALRIMYHVMYDVLASYEPGYEAMMYMIIVRAKGHVT